MGYSKAFFFWKVAESTVFQTNLLRNIRSEALNFNNEKYQTSPNCEAVMNTAKMPVLNQPAALLLARVDSQSAC